MIKLYQYKSAIVGEYAEPSKAVITRGRYTLSHSSYRGGTTEYLNVVELNLGFWIPRWTWVTVEHRS